MYIYIYKYAYRYDLDEDNESIENDDGDKESNDDSDDDEALEKKAAHKATTRRGNETGENSSRLESLIKTEIHNENYKKTLENVTSINDDGEDDDNVSELEVDFESNSLKALGSERYSTEKENKIRHISIFENEHKSMFPPFGWSANTGSKKSAHYTDECGKGGNMGKYI
jgi:hypothetical protein